MSEFLFLECTQTIYVILLFDTKLSECVFVGLKQMLDLAKDGMCHTK